MRLAPLVLVAMTVSATAQVRPGDTVFTAAELTDRLSGATVEFFDGSKARYGADGAYTYTYTDGGRAWRGTYATDDQSRVCVLFDTGHSRCDTYVDAGGRLTLIIADGTRFPVRSETPLQSR